MCDLKMNDLNWNVSIARCENYEPQAVKTALLEALAPIHGLDWVTPGMKIAVKANLKMQKKPEKAATYRDLHAHPWPGVNAMLKKCNIRNYSIYEREIDGKLYLFSYLEYTGTDFEADMKQMAADPETRRWWKETDPCQAPLPDARKAGKIWSDAKEVYHLD